MPTIQLTDRNPLAVWKIKNKEGKVIKEQNMEDMSDYELQGALVICQKRMLKSVLSFMNDKEREEQLFKAAKARNMDIKNMDDIKVTYYGAKFNEFEEIMSTAYTSIKIKQKKIAKQQYDASR